MYDRRAVRRAITDIKESIREKSTEVGQKKSTTSQIVIPDENQVKSQKEQNGSQ